MPAVPVVFREGPVALGGNLGAGSIAASGDRTVIGDLDLTNIEALQSLAGHDARGADLVARLYRREGLGVLGRLQGGFALAIWDRRREELILAVDQFGIKRLYFLNGPAATVFASRPSALRLGPLAPSVSAAAVFDYLNFSFVPAPTSIFRGVARLAPGHLLRARAGSVTPEA